MKKLLLLFTFLPLITYGTNAVSGFITNSETKNPISYATVYVDGSSIGTISDSSGFFILNKLPEQCKIVFSCIGYQTKIVNVIESIESHHKLNVSLTKKEIQLDEIIVQDKNLRAKNLKYFHDNFFGTDKWGDYAFLENDSVLSFSLENNEKNDSTRRNQEYPDIFKATANAPLNVKLPLLGYQIYINLSDFNVIYNNELNLYETKCIGFSYYTAIEVDSKFKQNKISKNRLKAYYNSKLHFLRALYNNKLEENGYLIVQRTNYDKCVKTEYEPFPIDSFIHFYENHVDLVGLKDKKIKIAFYSRKNKKPLDISNKTGTLNSFDYDYIQNFSNLSSDLYFKKDTCRIWSNGSVSSQSIMFGPSIGDKKLGALLPDDYIPQIEWFRKK